MGRNPFHRCCLEQNPRILSLLIRKLEYAAEKLSAKIDEEGKPIDYKEKIAKALNKRDHFNNTPLLLACVYDYENRREDQRKTVEILLGNKAESNVQNKFSGFTPIHW